MSKEKKERIYRSVWDIYVKGTDFGNIRMGEIAEASGVPKGTIYEYFRTKDQLIAESMLWSMGNEMELLCRKAEEVKGFEEKWNMVLEWVRSNAGRSLMAAQFMAGDKLPAGLKTAIQELPAEMCKGRDVNRQLAESMTEAAKADGIVSEEISPLAKNTAVLSALLPVLLYDGFPGDFDGVSWEETKDYSKRLLLAAFRGV